MLLIAILAGASMLISDLLATIMVQAEAANKGWLAGWVDVACWFVSITTTSISVTVLTGHQPLIAKALVVVFVSAANLFGTKLGTLVGARILRSRRFVNTDEIAQHFTPEQHAAILELVAGAARSGR